MKTNTITGEYSLRGVHDMASGFLIKEDGTFQFFMMYGSLDRHGSGKWTLENNKLCLNSGEQPPADFALVESKTGKEGKVIIRMTGINPHLYKHVYCSLEGGTEQTWEPMNESGFVEFTQAMPDTICLLFSFCGERFSSMPVVDKTRNDLTFRTEPWIIEVFLKDFVLDVTEFGLRGKHPLIEGNELIYERS